MPTSARFHYRQMCDVYLRHGSLTAKQFERLAEDALKIGALGVSDFQWTITYQILSVHLEIPPQVHYEAVAAAFGLPYQGIEALHVALVEAGLAPPRSLNRTLFFGTPPPKARLGELMFELGLINRWTLERAVELQERIQREVGVKPAIGILILALGNVSVPDLFQALALQAGIPYESLDASVPEICARLAQTPD